MDREEFRRRIEIYVSRETPDLANDARRIAGGLVEPLWALIEPWHALRRSAEASKHLEPTGEAADLRSAVNYLIDRTATGVPPEAWAEILDRLMWMLDDNGAEIMKVRREWVNDVDPLRAGIALAMAD